MPIAIQCPCGKSLKVADEAAGKRVKCPACGQRVAVPVAATPTKSQSAPSSGAPRVDEAETGGVMWIAWAAVAVVAIACGGVMYYLSQDNSDQLAVAAAPDERPSDTPSSDEPANPDDVGDSDPVAKSPDEAAPTASDNGETAETKSEPSVPDALTGEPAPPATKTPETEPAENPGPTTKPAAEPKTVTPESPAAKPATYPAPKAAEAKSSPEAKPPATATDPVSKPVEPPVATTPPPPAGEPPATPPQRVIPPVAKPPTLPTAELTGESKREFQMSLRNRSPDARVQAVRELVNFPHVKTADLILKTALIDPSELVRTAAADVLKSFQGHKDIGLFLLDQLQKEAKSRAPNEPRLRSLLQVLVAYEYPEIFLDLIGFIEYPKIEIGYAAAAQVMDAVDIWGARENAAALPIIAKLSESKYFPKHYGFRRCLVESAMQIPDPATIDFLLAALPKMPGTQRFRTFEYLQTVTQQKFGTDFEQWTKWWQDNRGTFRFPKETDVHTVVAGLKTYHPEQGEAIQYYGIPVTAKRVVFVLDTSASMNEGESEIHKLHAAKQALELTLDRLPEDTYFNIVVYNTGVQIWKPKLLAAKPTVKAEARQYVSRIQATGGTATFEALFKAFQLDGNLETIFLLSDGEPNLGRLTDPSEIMTFIYGLNRVQRVNIHTIGVFAGLQNPGMLEMFMKGMADQNEGLYRKVQ